MRAAWRLSLIGLAVALSSASAHAQVYRGNDTGGIIPWSCENEAVAQEVSRGLLRGLEQVRAHHQRASHLWRLHRLQLPVAPRRRALPDAGDAHALVMLRACPGAAAASARASSLLSVARRGHLRAIPPSHKSRNRPIEPRPAGDPTEFPHAFVCFGARTRRSFGFLRSRSGNSHAPGGVVGSHHQS